MQVHFGVDLLKSEWSESVVCIGTFDGIHLGHQAVISNSIKIANTAELPAILVTFDRHPSVVLAPSKAPKPITSLSQNLTAIEDQGIGLTVVLPFNAWLSRMSAEEFLDSILEKKLRAGHLVVGHDFALGNGREGTTEWLSNRIQTTVVDPFAVDGQRVSSSLIREKLSQGEIESANKLLGRPLEIVGFVVGGQKLGRTLGFPTANIARAFDQIMVPDGVYAVKFTCKQGEFNAALAVGTRPAVGGGPRSIEAFLLDYPGDSLYGQPIKMKVISRLREERNFSSLQALKDQMTLDVTETRNRLTNIAL